MDKELRRSPILRDLASIAEVQSTNELSTEETVQNLKELSRLHQFGEW